MGKSLKKLVLAVLILVASDAAVIAQDLDTHRKVDFYGSFDGRWEGKFSRTPIPAFDPSPNTTPATDIAFSINNTDVKVYLKPKGTWNEIKPGSFHIVSGATNAVVFPYPATLGLRLTRLAGLKRGISQSRTRSAIASMSL